jgi:hypothetical protein
MHKAAGNFTLHSETDSITLWFFALSQFIHSVNGKDDSLHPDQNRGLHALADTTPLRTGIHACSQQQGDHFGMPILRCKSKRQTPMRSGIRACSQQQGDHSGMPSL